MLKKIIVKSKLFYIRRFKNCDISIDSIISYPFTTSNSENIKIEKNCYIGPGARIYALGGVLISEGVIIGPNLTIYSSNHNYENASMIPYDNKSLKKKVIIERGCWIGDSVKLCPGTYIGEGCIVAMGSVLHGFYEKHSIIGGNPAKVIKKRNDIENLNSLFSTDNYYIALKRRANG